MIAVFEGVPGAGKSFTCVAEIVEALEQGKCVITNVELEPGWEKIAARSNFVRRCIPGAVAKAEARYLDRVFVATSLEELMRVRIAGEKEGRCLAIFDEAHNWMNARTWANEDRAPVVRWFTQHRKLGFDVYLVTQRAENIDLQVRALCEYRVTLSNLKRQRMMGIRPIPFNIFRQHWRWEGGNEKAVAKIKFRRLNKKVARLYNTLALSHGLEADDFEPIYLPHSSASPRVVEPHENARAPAAGSPDQCGEDTPGEAAA